MTKIIPAQKHINQRFAFGKNWQAFLKNVDEKHVTKAKDSLRVALKLETLEGLSFLDVGCGSGLFSLAALRLNATKVYSFDYDAQSVACTADIKRRFAPKATNWIIERGSILDESYLKHLGSFNIVYSWGVLHHTGNMWRSLELITRLVRGGGRLYIAIYNDQGVASQVWLWVKRAYNVLPWSLRFLVLIPALVRLWGPRVLMDMFQCRPFHTWRSYSKNRGMSPWFDVIDWVGGYPFEVAKPSKIVDFFLSQSFQLLYMRTVDGGRGCNEFVFTKI